MSTKYGTQSQYRKSSVMVRAIIVQGRKLQMIACLLKNRLDRRIDSPVARIVGRHDRRACWIRENAISYRDHRVASSVNRGPDLRAYSGENGGTISRAFFGFYALHFLSVDVRLDLPPELGTRAPAAETDAIHR